MGIVDTMMVGRLNAEAMGAVSVGGILFYTVAVVGMGVLIGMDAVVAQAWGAGKAEDCRHSLRSALWLCVPLTPLVMLTQVAWLPVLAWVGVHEDVRRQAGPYLAAIVWSVPPLLVYTAVRRYLQGCGVVAPVMFSLISANLVNVAANWLLIFGNWGAPRLEAAGAGWATTASRIYMAAVLLAWVLWRDRAALAGSWAVDLERIRAIARLGLPAGLQAFVEVAVFAAVTTLIGKLDPRSLAAHQIALSACSFSFMVPLGLGSAAAVRVGHAVGRGDPHGARVAGWTAILLGVAFMGTAGITFVTVPDWIGRLFTTDLGVVAAAGTMLVWVAVFQLFDGAQVVATGALRGAGNTRLAAMAHFTGYWILGLPLGWWLCFRNGWGAPGLWAGMAFALILIGLALLGAWRMVSENIEPVRKFPAPAATNLS